MADLDSLLRQRAHDHLAAEASRVDVDVELAAFRAATADHPTATVSTLPTVDDRPPSTGDPIRGVAPAPSGSVGRRWFAVAAAVTLVAGLGVALLTSGRDGGDPVPPLDTAPTPIDDSGATSTSLPSSPVLPESRAVADPTSVEAGGTVTITPDRVVQRWCLDIATVERVTNGELGRVGLLVDGRLDDSPEPTIPACEGETSAEAIGVRLPSDLAAGGYRVCIAGPDDPAGCALVDVKVGTATTPVEPPASTAPPATTEESSGTLVAPVPYLGRTDTFDDLARPVTIVRIGADGSVLGELDDAAYADVLTPVGVAPGVSIGIDRESRPEGGRCTWNRLGLTSDTQDPGFDLNDLGDVLGIAGSGTGYVVVSRDVCPDGSRWGDPGTYHEVVRYHLTDPSDPPVQIVRVDADPDAILFDDGGNLVVAPGELIPVSVDPTGRWIGVMEWRTIEDVRYHLFDATLAAGATGWGEPADVGTRCANPGHLAAVPRFEDVPALGGPVVVMARQCPVESEQFAVEAIRLDDGEVVWSIPVEDVSTNSYSGDLASLSTTVVDGELWAIVSGAGFEEPFHSALLQGDRQIEITEPGSDVLAFDLDDLIGDNEALGSFGG